VRRLIEVAIVEPHDGTRDALRDLLEYEDDLRVTAFRDAESMIAADRLADVDVVLADERLAGISSPAARITLDSLSKLTRVIAMGMGERDHYAEPVTKAGAAGYWPKFGDVDTLVRMVRAVGRTSACDALGARRRRRESARHLAGSSAKP
jgi:DNA-binding NarL/FixJ family response regulator